MKRKKKRMSTAARVLLCSWCVLMLLVTFFIIKWALNLPENDAYVNAGNADNIANIGKDELRVTPPASAEGDEDQKEVTPAPTGKPVEPAEFVTEYAHAGEMAEELAVESGVSYGLRYPVYEDVAASDAAELAAREVLKNAVAELANSDGKEPKLVIDYEDGETEGLLSVLFYIETEIDGAKEIKTSKWVYNKKKSEVVDADSLFTTPAYRYIAEQVNALQTAEGNGTEAEGEAGTKDFAGTQEEFSSYLLTAEGAKFYYETDGTRKEILIPYFEIYAYMEVTTNGTVWADHIRDLDPEKPMIALTFDDGPHYEQTPRLLEILDKYDVKSTFFILGDRVTWGESNKKALQMVYDAGHEVGSHTYTHAHLKTLSVEEIKEEVTKTRDVIYSVIGEYPVFVRPPYGQYDERVQKYSYAPLVNWNIDSLDWDFRNADQIVEHVLKEARDGMIVLSHDIHWFTVDAMERIIPELQARGYQIVTVRELLYHHNVEIENGKVYHSSFN